MKAMKKAEPKTKVGKVIPMTERTIKHAVDRYCRNVGATFPKCHHPVRRNAYVSRTKTRAGTPILRVRCLIEHQKQCAKLMRKARRMVKQELKGRPEQARKAVAKVMRKQAREQVSQ